MPPAADPTRLAFVGLGSFALQLAEAAQRSGVIEITACYTRTPEKRERFGVDFHCRVLSSFEAVCQDPDIEGVVLVTPNDTHSEQTEALAAAGKHIFVEKPLCNTLDEADRMIAACQDASVLLAVGHQERRHSPYRTLKAMMDSGELGRVFCFEANHCGNLLGAWPEDDWRFSSDRGVGPLLHKGIHKIDILNYLFDSPESVTTLASPLAINPDMHETTVSAVRYASGVLGSLTSGFAYNNATFNVYGEKKSVFHSGYGSSVKIKDEKAWEFSDLDCGPDDPLAEELTEFALAIRGQASIEVTGAIAREAILLAVAAREAARGQRPVLLDELRVSKALAS